MSMMRSDNRKFMIKINMCYIDIEKYDIDGWYSGVVYQSIPHDFRRSDREFFLESDWRFINE